MTFAPARSPQIFSCSMAAARKVSPAASMTLRPSARNFAASLPMVVVLPEPLTPTTRMTKGLAALDDKRLRHGREHLLDLGGQHGLHLVGRDRLVVAALAQRRGDAAGGLDAEIGADQHLLDFLEHGGIELALGHQIGRARRRATTTCALSPPVRRCHQLRLPAVLFGWCCRSCWTAVIPVPS